MVIKRFNVVLTEPTREKLIRVSTKVGPQGPPGPPGGAALLEDAATDVDVTGRSLNSVLVWDDVAKLWRAQNFLLDMTIDGGTF